MVRKDNLTRSIKMKLQFIRGKIVITVFFYLRKINIVMIKNSNSQKGSSGCDLDSSWTRSGSSSFEAIVEHCAETRACTLDHGGSDCLRSYSLLTQPTLELVLSHRVR